MNIKFPKNSDHKVYEMIDADAMRSTFAAGPLATYAATADFAKAVSEARKFLSLEAAAKSVNAVCYRADGQIWLVTITRRAWKKIWSFGNIESAIPR